MLFFVSKNVLFSHLILMTSRVYLLQSVMGLAYSILASALWPMVALVVKEHQLGTAYGM